MKALYDEKHIDKDASQGNVLSTQLQTLYSLQDTLQKLIDDESIPTQKMDEYYVDLQIMLDNGDSNEKQPIEVAKLFDATDKLPAVDKVLVIGKAGVGKTTFLHHIAYEWGKGRIFNDKFDYIFKIKLKMLLDPALSAAILNVPRSERLAKFIQINIEQQQFELESRKQDEMTYIINQGIKHVDIQNLDKQKTLLLLDGYDEIVHLASKVGHVAYEIMQRIFEYNVVLTSRPNALSTAFDKKFTRRVENTGLNQTSAEEYIHKYFTKTKSYLANAEEIAIALRTLLVNNPSLREIIVTPINLSMLCLICSDIKIIEQFSGEVNAGKLYEEAIIWLGKRYLINVRNKMIQDITAENIQNLEHIKVLQELAYDKFKVEQLTIDGEAISKYANRHRTDIRELNEFGLLRPEFTINYESKNQVDHNNLIQQNHIFIHLSFQEYLTASRLKTLLLDKEQVHATSELIARHRNEARWQMTLKFLSGIIANEKVEDKTKLARLYWEAIACNIDGVLELTVDKKVSLFMHLLAQSKIGGRIDHNIPNIAEMIELIDKVTMQNIVIWNREIIASGYLSEAMKSNLFGIVKRACAQNIATDEKVAEPCKRDSVISAEALQIIELNTALNLLLNFMPRLSKQETERLLGKVQGLISSDCDYAVKAGCLKVMSAIIIQDQTLELGYKKNLITMIVGLLGDDNLADVAVESLKNITKQNNTEEITHMLNELDALKTKSVHQDLRAQVVITVLRISEVMYDNYHAKDMLAMLKSLFNDENDRVRRNAIYVISNLVDKVDNREILDALNLFEKSIEGKSKYKSNMDFSGIAYEILRAIDSVHKTSQSSLVVSESLSMLSNYLSTESRRLRCKAAAIIKRIDQEDSLLKQEASKVIDLLLNDKKSSVREAAAEELGIVLNPLANKPLSKLIELLDNKDPASTLKIVNAIYEYIVNNGGRNNALEAFSALRKLLDDPNANVRYKIADFMNMIASIDPIRKEILKNLVSLINDGNKAVRLLVRAKIWIILRDFPDIENTQAALKSFIDLLNNEVNVGIADIIYLICMILQNNPNLERSSELITKFIVYLKSDNKEIKHDVCEALGEAEAFDIYNQEILQALESLTTDADFEFRVEVVKTLGEVGRNNILVNGVVQALSMMIHDEDEDVRRQVVSALENIGKSIYNIDLAKTILLLLTQMLKDKDSRVRDDVVEAISRISKKNNALIITEEALSILMPLLENKERYNIHTTITALGKIAKASNNSTVVRKLLPIFVALINEKDSYTRKKAIKVLGKIGGAIYDITIAKEILENISNLLNDKDFEVKEQLPESIGQLVHNKNDLISKESLKLLFVMLNHDYQMVRFNAISQIDLMCRTIFDLPNIKNAMVHLLKVYHGDKYDGVSGSASYAIDKIIAKMPIEELVIFLKDQDVKIRSSSILPVITYLNKLPSQKDLKLTETILKDIIGYEDENGERKDLIKAAKRVLYNQQEYIDEEVILFATTNFKKLFTGSESSKEFFKAVFHKALGDGEISQTDFDFIILCVKAGFATSIIREDKNYQIIFEDKTYILSGEANHQYIEEITKVILNQENEFIARYKQHNPLFKNSGDGLAIASLDIPVISSIINQKNLESECWQLTFVQESDNLQSKPNHLFVILEKRDLFGKQVIYKITSELDVSKYIMHPNDIGVDFCRIIFGDMPYNQQYSVYYGAQIILSDKQVEDLLQQTNKDKQLSLRSIISNYMIVLDWDNYTKNAHLYYKEDLHRMPKAEYEKSTNIRNIIDLKNKANEHDEKIDELAIELKHYQEESNTLIESMVNELAEFDEKTAPILKQYSVKQDRIAKIEQILQNDNSRDYYLYFKTMIISSYVGSSALLSKKVSANSSSVFGDVISSLSSQIPFAGIAGKIIQKISRAIDKRHHAQIAHKIIEVLPTSEEAELVAEFLAIRLIENKHIIINSATNEQAVGVVDKARIYKEKLQSWMSGHPITNAAEKLAEEDIGLILEMIGKGEIVMQRRNDGDVRAHCMTIADVIIGCIAPNNNVIAPISISAFEPLTPRTSMIKASEISNRIINKFILDNRPNDKFKEGFASDKKEKLVKELIKQIVLTKIIGKTISNHHTIALVDSISKILSEYVKYDKYNNKSYDKAGLHFMFKKEEITMRSLLVVKIEKKVEQIINNQQNKLL